MRRLLAVWLMCTPLLAQDQEVLLRVEGRVTAVLGPVVHLDRGSASGIEPGDRVLVLPLGGETLQGKVHAVEDRSCQIQLDNGTQGVEPGMRAEVLVPRDRTPAEKMGTKPVHPRWKSGEGPWDPNVPLLAMVSPPTPEERPPHWFGRVYAMGEWVDDSEHGQSFFYAREGIDVRYENPFSRGGALRFDGEFDARRVTLNDGPDQNEDRLRVDRLSYAWGGDRERPRHYEVGRFLQRELPELGVLDGVEVSQRLETGDRVGASLGFLPEPNESFTSGKDFQTAVYYRHVRGEREELSLAGAFQKTWHKGQEDRDLFLANARWYPGTGWSAWSSAWIDLYGPEDQAKGAGVEVTMLSAGVGRRWGNDAGANLTVSHFRFPELLRNEFADVTFTELADDRTDRVSLSSWRRLSDTIRLYGRVDQWTDEDSSGGGGELRVDQRDALFDRSRMTVALTTQSGRFSDVTGMRASLGGITPKGSWDVAWDYGQHSQSGFLGQQSDLDQHRLRARWDMRTGAGWDVSLYGEQRFGDEQDAMTLGFYIQRSF